MEQLSFLLSSGLEYTPKEKKRAKASLDFLLSSIKYKQIADKEVKFPRLPDKKYGIIYCDPPWHYGQHWQYTRPGYKWGKGCDRYYPCVPTPELAKLNVSKISDENCLLFMWATNPHIPQAVALGQIWGFDYCTIAFVWDKETHNPGRYTISQCEVCLLFKKGKIPTPRGARNIRQLIRSKRSKKHSRKPEEARRRIEAMFPEQKKIELFATKKTNGWKAWGNGV